MKFNLSFKKQKIITLWIFIIASIIFLIAPVKRIYHVQLGNEYQKIHILFDGDYRDELESKEHVSVSEDYSPGSEYGYVTISGTDYAMKMYAEKNYFLGWKKTNGTEKITFTTYYNDRVTAESSMESDTENISITDSASGNNYTIHYNESMGEYIHNSEMEQNLNIQTADILAKIAEAKIECQELKTDMSKVELVSALKYGLWHVLIVMAFWALYCGTGILIKVNQKHENRTLDEEVAEYKKQMDHKSTPG